MRRLGSDVLRTSLKTGSRWNEAPSRIGHETNQCDTGIRK
jgi:hypothetical protein